MKKPKSAPIAAAKPISAGNSGISEASLRMFNSVPAQRSGNIVAKPANREEPVSSAKSIFAKAGKGKHKNEPAQNATPEVDMSKVVLPRVEAFNPFKIRPMKNQIRQRFFGIDSLANSIDAVGQLVPVIVVKIDGNPDFDAQLVDGEGRLKACMLLKRGISAYVWEGGADIETLFEASVAANCNRHDHDPVERLAAVLRMKNNGRTDKHIADIFGKSVGWVGQQFMLRKLHPTVLNWMIPVVKGKEGGDTGSVSSGSRRIKAPLSFQLGLLLSQVKPAESQIPLAKEIIGQKMSLAQAQHYIASALRGVSGIQRNSHHHAGEKIASLGSQARGMEYKLRTYTDMADSEIQILLGRLDESHIQSLDTSLERLFNTVSTLRETIHRSLPRGMRLKIKAC
ncbi:MAG: hypothetical protein A2401_01355 [Candidatus Staskawiczbacteria bacterium RIFOXYC1_FULL_38_18]|uniref:ParB-like N-terminal domain-containing protein n=1 Tax=Candidatus Staskawiczbacteria bacterium RIFOXYC1_FULL_38_18 TaxID=1802229 RepID=A0A1G2JCD2_9BACT|nr:MAG: hypothetical protein A2401_01355 [Candidatus Staskawiczbacteria bacterium RIFOXYC1_FULL_38_18]